MASKNSVNIIKQNIEEKLSLSIELIEEAMEKAFNDIEGKEEEYQ